MMLLISVSGFANTVTVIPKEYNPPLRNPLKGFTSGSEWETLRHFYIPWRSIEKNEEDTIDSIRKYCDTVWEGLEQKNIKVIPRVYLHWSGDKKFWPSDLSTDDYTSPAFQKRLVRLVHRLGLCWDTDPRVAFVEMGIFGKWGEHHSPSPTKELQAMAGKAFAEAFRNKLVSVRHPWEEFSSNHFGVYWDSWAHINQLESHGKQIRLSRAGTLWTSNYIGGEVAYDWGDGHIQPGKNPTETVKNTFYRDFLINSIRWLHCTQLRWVSNYDGNDPEARRGAELIQKALGYRFILVEVTLSCTEKLSLSLKVRNTGSAPFYYDWPVEVSLLDPLTRSVIWKTHFKNVDIRSWLPGNRWPDPTWEYAEKYDRKIPGWDNKNVQWTNAPQDYQVHESFQVEAPPGDYIVALAILDPAGNVPSIRFANQTYLKGGRTALGMYYHGKKLCDILPNGFIYDDPYQDMTLRYHLPKFCKK